MSKREDYFWPNPPMSRFTNLDGQKHVDVIEEVLPGMKLRNGVEGVGPEAPMVVNEKGGKQSLVKGRFDLLPPLALIEVAKVLEEGAKKYGEDNWRNISSGSHLNHLMQHVLAYLAGDRSDDHLGHMTCRALMCHEMAILEGQDDQG